MLFCFGSRPTNGDEYVATPLEAQLLRHGRSEQEDNPDHHIEERLSHLSIHEGLSAQQEIYMEVVEEYFPCSALELPVKEGERVKFLSNEGQWIFVQTENGANGYIPRRHCKITNHLRGRVLPVEALDRRTSRGTEYSDVGYFSDSHPLPIPARVHAASMSSGTPQSTQSESERARSSSSTSVATTPEQRRTKPNIVLTFDDSHERSEDPTTPTAESDHGLFTSRGRLRYKDHRSSKLCDDILFQSGSYYAPVCGRRCKQNNCSHSSAGLTPQNVRKTRPRALTDDVPRQRYSASYDINGKEHMPPKSAAGNPVKKRVVYEDQVISEKEKAKSMENLHNLRNAQVVNKTFLIDETCTALEEHKQMQQRLLDKWQQHQKPVHKRLRSRSNSRANLRPSSIGCNHPELIVIEDYEQCAKTDISVRRGGFAKALDTSNPAWTYIEREDGRHGFVPKEVIIKHQCKNCFYNSETDSSITPTPDHDTNNNGIITQEPASNTTNPEKQILSKTDSVGDPTKYIIPDISTLTKMIVSESYIGKDLDDLHVATNDIVYANMADQLLQGWLWVYSPRNKLSGYIPQRITKCSEIQDV